MEDNKQQELLRKVENDFPQAFATPLRIAASFLPVVGSVVSELITLALDHKQKAIVEYLVFLSDEFKKLDDAHVKLLNSQEKFRTLIEAGAEAYSKADSDKRREYIKRILKTGFTLDQALLEQKKHLLSIFSLIPDPAIVLLASHSSNLSNVLLKGIHPEGSGFRDRERTEVFYRTYKLLLIQHGLLVKKANPRPMVKDEINPTYQERGLLANFEQSEHNLDSEISDWGEYVLKALGLTD